VFLFLFLQLIGGAKENSARVVLVVWGAVSKENPGEAKENSLQYLPFGDIQFYNCSRDVTRRRLVGLSEKHSYGA